MLIHIGFHKTASTLLQVKVFREPRFGFSLFPMTEVAPLLVDPHPLDYSAPATRFTLDAWQGPVTGLGLVPVLSHERLSGYPASGGFDSVELADRLRAACPNARILIIVREQEAMIRSYYKQYVRDGGIQSLREFLTYPQMRRARRVVPGFTLDFFRYDRLVAYYHAQFGRENVMVLPFEHLRTAPTEFVAAIQRHAGVAAEVAPPTQHELSEVNPSLANPGVTLQRWFNRTVRQSELSLRPWLWPAPNLRQGGARFMAAINRITPAALDRWWERKQALLIRKIVGTQYIASNHTLAQLTGLDLQSLGYRCK